MTAWYRHWPPVVGQTYFGRRKVTALEPYELLVYWSNVADPSSPLHNWRMRTRADNWVRWCAAQERKGLKMFEDPAQDVRGSGTVILLSRREGQVFDFLRADPRAGGWTIDEIVGLGVLPSSPWPRYSRDWKSVHCQVRGVLSSLVRKGVVENLDGEGWFRIREGV